MECSVMTDSALRPRVDALPVVCLAAFSDHRALALHARPVSSGSHDDALGVGAVDEVAAHAM